MDLVETKFTIILLLGLFLLSFSFALFTGIKEQLEFVILILFGYLYGLLTGVMVLYLETSIEDVEAALNAWGLAAIDRSNRRTLQLRFCALVSRLFTVWWFYDLRTFYLHLLGSTTSQAVSSSWWTSSNLASCGFDFFWSKTCLLLDSTTLPTKTTKKPSARLGK